MHLPTPLTADARAPLAQANPVAKLGAALLLMAVLFWSIDAVTAGVVLVGLVGTIPFTGLRPRALLARSWPVLLLALLLGALSVLLAGGQAGPLAPRGPPILGGIGLSLRLVAIALVGLLALATSEPIDLADALMAQLRVPASFAVGVMAALRLVPVLADEWRIIGMARRARGLDAGRNPVAALQVFGGRLFGLLVAAVRRGARLATAMEGRGFGAGDCRTMARPTRMRAADWALVAAAALLGAGAVGFSVGVGTWQPLL